MNIITGYRGEPHITSAQDRATNQGTFGTGSYILNVGNLMTPQIVSSNEIRITDGVLCMQGCVANIDFGSYDTCEIANGSQGMQRRDLIVARYTRDVETDIEDISLVVITGTPSSTSPSDPEYNTGNIQAGDNPVDFPLYRVNINGVNVTGTTKLAASVRTQEESDALLTSLNNLLTVNSGTFSKINTVSLNAATTLHKIGNVVYFNIDATTSEAIASGASGAGFVVFPSGFRPGANKDFVGRITSGTIGEYFLQTNGNLQTLTAISAGSTFRLSGSFVTV